MNCKMNTSERTRKNARTFAKSSTRLGAVAGGRIGPVTTGIASGLGGAVGYLTGAAVDGVQTSLEEKPPVTDGGHPQERNGGESRTEIPIPVTEEF